MLHTSDIADALRAHGFKFGQVKLISDLGKYEPAARAGRIVFYDDSVLTAMIERYTKERPVPATKELKIDPIAADLAHIRKMLTAICESLQITV